MRITTIGLDLAKNVFQLHGVDAGGRAVLRKRLSRQRLLEFFANLPRCLVGMEACGSAHFWARELERLGHDVRLMPACYVRPCVKRNKHDAADAEAVCEAVARPSMRFVPIKSEDQQSALLVHRARELLVRQRTRLVNALRGHLGEFGVAAARGITKITGLLALVEDPEDHRVPPLARDVLSLPVEQLRAVDNQVIALECRLVAPARSPDRACVAVGSAGLLPADGIAPTRSASAWRRSPVSARSPRQPWSRPWAILHSSTQPGTSRHGSGSPHASTPAAVGNGWAGSASVATAISAGS